MTNYQVATRMISLGSSGGTLVALSTCESAAAYPYITVFEGLSSSNHSTEPSTIAAYYFDTAAVQ